MQRANAGTRALLTNMASFMLHHETETAHHNYTKGKYSSLVYLSKLINKLTSSTHKIGDIRHLVKRKKNISSRNTEQISTLAVFEPPTSQL